MEKPEKEGGLNRDENDWYAKSIMAHSDKVQREGEEKRVKAENRARLGPAFEELEIDPQAYKEKWQKAQAARALDETAKNLGRRMG